MRPELKVRPALRRHPFAADRAWASDLNTFRASLADATVAAWPEDVALQSIKADHALRRFRVHAWLLGVFVGARLLVQLAQAVQ